MVDKKPPPSGSVVNLRQARKQRDRAAHAANGDANRARHGVSSAEKSLEAARREKSLREHDGARRTRDDAPEKSSQGDDSDN